MAQLHERYAQPVAQPHAHHSSRPSRNLGLGQFFAFWATRPAGLLAAGSSKPFSLIRRPGAPIGGTKPRPHRPPPKTLGFDYVLSLLSLSGIASSDGHPRWSDKNGGGVTVELLAGARTQPRLSTPPSRGLATVPMTPSPRHSAMWWRGLASRGPKWFFLRDGAVVFLTAVIGEPPVRPVPLLPLLGLGFL
jgi:hypothetical protein